MKRFIVICAVLVLFSIMNAQHNDADEAVIRLVADYILGHSEFAFHGIINKQTYHSSQVQKSLW